MKIDVHSVTVQACAAVAATMRQTQICFQCKEKRTIKTHTQAHTHIYIYYIITQTMQKTMHKTQLKNNIAIPKKCEKNSHHSFNVNTLITI
jgi:hypothetical protein